MADMTDRDLRELAKRIAQESELGARGEIANLLRDIGRKLDNVQSSTEEVTATQVSSSKMTSRWLEAANRASSSSGGGMSDDWMPDLSRDSSYVSAKNGLVKSLAFTRDAAGKLKESFSRLSNSTDSFGSLITGIVGGGTLAKFATWADKSAEALRETYDVGQTFNGSLTDFNYAAASAALPLGDFTKMIVKNAPLLASLGGAEGFGGLQKMVRNNMMSIGAMGLQTDEVVELLSDYVSTQSAYGYLDEVTRVRTASSFQNLIEETTALANITGRSRKDMMKQVNDAAKNTTLQAGLFQLPAKQAQMITQNLASVNAVFSSFGSQSGDFLTQLMAQGASGISSALSSQGSELVNAGMGGLINDIDRMGARLRKGEKITSTQSLDFMEKFYKQAKSNMSVLQAQSNAGNQSATAVVKMYNEIQAQMGDGGFAAMRKKMAEKQVKDNEPFTRFINNFGETVKKVTTAFNEMFYQIAGSSIDSFLNSIVPAEETMTGLVTVAKGLAYALGTLVKGVMWFGEGVSAVAKGVDSVVQWFTSFLTDDAEIKNAVSAGLLATLAVGGVGLLAVLKIVLIKGLAGLFRGMVNYAAKPLVLEMTRLVDSMRRAGGRRSAGLGAAGGGGLFDMDFGNDENNRNSGRGRGRGRGMGRLGGKLLKATKVASIGGLATLVGGAALDTFAPDDMAGKDTISAMLEYGGWGATLGGIVGTIFPVVGNAIGAAVGAAGGAVVGAVVANWEEVKAFSLSAWESIGQAFTDMFKWFAEIDWMGGLKTALSFTPVGFLVSNFDKMRTGIKNIFSNIGNVFGDAFAWVGSLDIRGAVKNAIMSIPMPDFIRGDVMSMVDKALPATGVTPPAAPQTAPSPPPIAPQMPPMPVTAPEKNEDWASIKDAMMEQNRLLAELIRHTVAIRDANA